MKRVLLTGATGFVGRELPAKLAAMGYEVHALGRTQPDAMITGWHSCDLLNADPSSLVRAIKPTHLLHLAWDVEPGRFWDAPDNLDWVAASLRLVRAFGAEGGARVVVAGTCAEYDWSYPLLDERTTPLNPASLYGAAKAAVFRLLEAAAPTLGLSFAWGRIFFPFGPHEKPGRLLPNLFDSIARGEKADFSAGTQQRDFIHVEDVGAAFAALLDSDVEGPVNIASGDPIPVRTLVERAARIAGGTHLISFGTRPIQPGEPPIMAAAVDRLHREVGFIPKFNLDAGIEDMFRRRSKISKQKGFIHARNLRY